MPTRPLTQVETCAEMEEVVMDFTQDMIDLADTMPFDLYLDGDLDDIPEETEEASDLDGPRRPHIRGLVPPAVADGEEVGSGEECRAEVYRLPSRRGSGH
jgi:hypothetical protein